MSHAASAHSCNPVHSVAGPSETAPFAHHSCAHLPRNCRQCVLCIEDSAQLLIHSVSGFFATGFRPVSSLGSKQLMWTNTSTAARNQCYFCKAYICRLLQTAGQVGVSVSTKHCTSAALHTSLQRNHTLHSGCKLMHGTLTSLLHDSHDMSYLELICLLCCARHTSNTDRKPCCPACLTWPLPPSTRSSSV